MNEANLSAQRNLDGEIYIDDNWEEYFDKREDAVEYFHKLSHYANLLNVSKDQKEEFIETKSYSDVSPSDIDDWINHFGSISKAVSYAENRLRNEDFEKGEKGDWDLKVETALDWAIDDKFSQRETRHYSNIVTEEIERYDEFEIYDGEIGAEAEILWNGKLRDLEE